MSKKHHPGHSDIPVITGYLPTDLQIVKGKHRKKKIFSPISPAPAVGGGVVGSGSSNIAPNAVIAPAPAVLLTRTPAGIHRFTFSDVSPTVRTSRVKTASLAPKMASPTSRVRSHRARHGHGSTRRSDR